MGLQANSAPLRNNQANTGTAESTLTTAGDILINNNLGQLRRLPIGEEDFALLVENGQPVWRRSTGELFKIGYCSEPVGDYWDATWGATGVPFSQDNLTQYNHANKVYANLKYIDGSGNVLTKSTSAQGGYTTANMVLYKGNCQELWVTVDTDTTNLAQITDNLLTTGVSAINDISQFIQDEVISGVDLLITDPASLSVTGATNLNTWLGDLKSEINNNAGASVNITLPALGNATIAGNHNFDYSTFINNVNTLTINCCCVMNDYGYGYPNCPVELLIGGRYTDKNMTDDVADEQGATDFYEGGILGKYTTDNNNHLQKLVIKIPNNGFSHDDTVGAYTIVSDLTRNKINLDDSTYNTNLLNGNRDSSGELRWFTGSHTVTFCDGYAMRRKAELVRQWLKKYELDNPTLNKPLYELIYSSMGGGNHSYYSP